MDKLNIALNFLEEVNKLGYEAYLIGGSTRDHLLGRPINDIDITTNMPILKVNEIFGRDYKLTNRFLGTKITYAGIELEITAFRRELSYKDHRHPVVVLANSLKEDLARRDFTINAIAMDRNKRIYDKYHGINDLSAKVIKTIGRPTRRFNEDALRILRACYFSIKLDFRIEPKTMAGIRKKLHLLKNLQTLTILTELIKIFKLKNKEMFRLFKRIKLTKHLPYLKTLFYNLEKNNYYPESLVELIYLISYFNGSLLDVNIKKEYKRRITKALALKKTSYSFAEILRLLEKGEVDV